MGPGWGHAGICKYTVKKVLIAKVVQVLDWSWTWTSLWKIFWHILLDKCYKCVCHV